VAVLSAIGEDGAGFDLEAALNRRGIQSDLLVRVPRWQTFTYTKLLNLETGAEDQPRVDYINTQPTPEEAERQILNHFQSCGGDFDVILVSDQAETEHGGVVTPAVRSLVGSLALEHPDRVYWVDSRMRPELFRNVIVKPNQQEAEAACQRLFGATDYVALLRQIGGPFLMVTAGPRGALVVGNQSLEWVRGRGIENPVDICGAGDSFSAGASMALAVTGSAREAARIGNLVASVTIMKKGTGTASPAEVLAAEAAAGR
jgi:sugar/nucleoside kinase (ribokinase family)